MKKEPEVIEIVPYDPRWTLLYQQEATLIAKALGDACVALHHFGSTAVPGLSAKPKIDILAVVKKFSLINTSAIEQLGFEYRGEVIPTGRYFAKAKPRVHLHLFEEGNPLIARNLTFRDWLRTHADDCQAYAQLKSLLATQHTDGMVYCRAKGEFIEKIIKKALDKKS